VWRATIAEGDERQTDRDAVRFFYMAKGSVAELRTQILIAHEIGYLDADSYNKLDEEAQSLANMLGRLVKVRAKSFNP